MLASFQIQYLIVNIFFLILLLIYSTNSRDLQVSIVQELIKLI